MRSIAEWEAALEGAHLDGVTLNWLDNGRDPVTGQDLGVRIVYYDGGHTGGEIDLPSGGLICESVPGEIAPLFVLAPKAVEEVVRLRRELAKVGEVLARLDREYATVATSNPRPGRDEHTAGYLSGIDTAYTWLQKALEGTHE